MVGVREGGQAPCFVSNSRPSVSRHDEHFFSTSTRSTAFGFFDLGCLIASDARRVDNERIAFGARADLAFLSDDVASVKST